MIATLQSSDTYPDDLSKPADVEFWNAVRLSC